jgi:hypothetical protein
MGSLTASPTAAASITKLAYTYGPNLGQTWGWEVYGYYNASAAEHDRDPPVRDYRWRDYVVASDWDDGTLNGSWGGIALGESTELVPHVVVEPGGQAEGWEDLATGLDLIPPSIDEGLDDVSLGLDTISRAATIIRPDATTHPDDVGNPDDLAAPPSPTGTATFAAAGGLPALWAAPTLMLSLSKPISILMSGIAMLGGMAAAIWSSGIIPAMSAVMTTVASGSWLTSWDRSADAAASIGNRLGNSAETEDGSIAAILERIAVAIEAIQGEVVRDTEDPLAKPGIVNAVELASQARSEITLRSHGQMVTCSTGVIEEE